MKRVVRIMLLLLAGIGTANAGIIINVSDNGGYAEFSFSGSDVFTSTGAMYNGLWITWAEIPNLWISGDNMRRNVTSGSASFSFNTSVYGINDVWEGYAGSYGIGFRHTTSVGGVSAGDTVSMSGSILTDILYTEFNPGTHSSAYIGPYTTNYASVRDGVVINVGESNNVPAPSALALLGLGLAGIGYRQRKQIKAA